MNLIAANTNALRKRFPETYQRIQKCPHQKKPPAIRNKAKGFFAIERGPNTIYPYGNTDSKNLINRWLDSITLNEGTLYGITGFGDGSHIEALLHRCPENSCLLIAEDDLSALRTIFTQKNCARLLKDPRLLLGTGTIDQAFFKLVGEVPFSEIKEAEPLIYSPLYSLNESYYSQFLAGLAQNIDVYSHTYHSMVRCSGFHQEQIIHNFAQLFSAPDVGITRDCFKGHSLILVGAGPSLDESIDFLKEAQEHSIIVSVNSSHRKLINSDIRPHATVAADARVSTFRGYDRVFTDNIYLMCPYFVHPKVVAKFPGTTFTWAVNQTLVNALRKRLGLPPPTPIVELGTISSCVVDLARLWGCKKVCLVGQDFAITADGKSHTDDSFYADDDQNTLDTEECRLLPGNTLKEVHVDSQLFVYLKTFEQLAEDYQDLEFINTARLGAAVKGIPYYSYEKAAEWIQTGHTVDAPETFKTLIEQHQNDPEIEIEQCQEALRPTLEFADKLLSLALEAALYSESLPAKYEKKNYAKHNDIQKALKYADKVNGLLNSHPVDYAILFDGEAKKHLSHYMETKRKIDCEYPHWQSICENKEYFWAIAESAHFLRSRLRHLDETFTLQVLQKQKELEEAEAKESNADEESEDSAKDLQLSNDVRK